MVKKEKQTKLIVTKRPVRSSYKAQFNKRKKELRSLYKKYKVGIVTDEDLTDEQRVLLKKYYGVSEQTGEE